MRQKKNNISRMSIAEVLIIRHVCIKRTKSLQLIREEKKHRYYPLRAPIRGEQNRIKIFDDWPEIIHVLLLLLLSRRIVIHVSFQ